MMLSLPCLYLVLAFTAVTVTGHDQDHAHPAVAETRASVAKSEETSNDLRLQSRFTSAGDLLSRFRIGLGKRSHSGMFHIHYLGSKSLSKRHYFSLYRSLIRPDDVGVSSTLFQYLVEELRLAHTKLEGQDSVLQKLQTRLNTLDTSLKGSTFIRWGRKNCPSNTTLVYRGVAGGKMYKDAGGGTNRLCLSGRPQYDDTAIPQRTGHLFGAEYQNIGDHHDHDVPCSVCLTPQASTIMIPATLTCPPGWIPRYSGHLVGQVSWGSDHYATEYVCLDDQPENSDSGVRNDDGLLFFLVVSRCGSLPCPPFIENRVVTCVVCSK